MCEAEDSIIFGAWLDEKLIGVCGAKKLSPIETEKFLVSRGVDPQSKKDKQVGVVLPAATSVEHGHEGIEEKLTEAAKELLSLWNCDVVFTQ